MGMQERVYFKGHLFCKQCLHDLQFLKTRSSSPNLSKLARADISCQFIKTRSLCRHCLQNEWTLVTNLKALCLRKSMMPFVAIMHYFA